MLCQPEVEDFHQSIRQYHKIFGLQIPVGNARFMRPSQALGNLRRNLNCLPNRQQASVQQLAQCLPLYQLHRDIVSGALLSALVNRNNVWMVERRRCKRLPLEPMQEVFAFGEFDRQNLEGDIALQDDIPSEIHDAHSPGAERLDDAVMAKVCAGCQITAGGRDTARKSRFVHRMAQGLPEKAAKPLMVGKEVIYHAAEFRNIATSSIQKGNSLLRWQIESDSEEFLGGLLKIGHSSYPVNSPVRLLLDFGSVTKVPVVSGSGSDYLSVDARAGCQVGRSPAWSAD